MSLIEMQPNSSFIQSEIAGYYKNKSIFITGATGFIGKVLIEKLLRSCPDLKRIYILIRSKKGHSITERLNDLFKCQVSFYLTIQNFFSTQLTLKAV